MNNNVLQALIHFFKDTDTSQPMQWDKKRLADNLHQFGASMAELENMLTSISLWFASEPQQNTSLSAKPANYPVQPHTGMRVYSADECAKISKKSRSFLANLEHMGILTPQLREHVIDQLLQADGKQEYKTSLSRTKWIAFQTVFQNTPGIKVAYLEWLLFRDMIEVH